jgi:hypothetical protein
LKQPRSANVPAHIDAPWVRPGWTSNLRSPDRVDGSIREVEVTWERAKPYRGQAAHDLTSSRCLCMSSSRPSRRSSSSSSSTTLNHNSKPKWRSPYHKDARAKTTLSLVFAEPEEPKSISPGTAEKHIASMHDAINSE